MMNKGEVKSAFEKGTEELTNRGDLAKFLSEALREELEKIDRHGYSVSPADLYLSGLMMGMIMKRIIDEGKIDPEDVIASIQAMMRRESEEG